MKKLICLMLAFLMSLMMMPTAFAASGEEVVAANTLNALGLFNGTGTNSDGRPIYDLDRAPNRHEAVTMLVRLLGKDAEAKAGDWDIPFTDVADWARPYVGYAYANGLTSGTGKTTFGGNATVTASQYLTFVLRALGYDSSTDFRWDAAWELSDDIGLTDGRYTAKTKQFLRSDVTFVSRTALDVKQKDSEQTLAKKLIAEKVFSADAYKKAVESQEVLREPIRVIPDVSFTIGGNSERITSNDVRAEAGSYIVTPYLRGERFDVFTVQVERGTGTVTKNSDGTFTVDYPEQGNLNIALFYDPVERVVVNPDGSQSTSVFWTKRSLQFNTPIPREGFVLDRNDTTIYPDGRNFGDNFSSYFVMDVYYNGVRLSDYTVTAEAGAPFTAHIQADGSLLLMKTGDGSGKFTVTYQGQSAVFGASMLAGKL